jgi:hypothetical protein
MESTTFETAPPSTGSARRCAAASCGALFTLGILIGDDTINRAGEPPGPFDIGEDSLGRVEDYLAAAADASTAHIGWVVASAPSHWSPCSSSARTSPGGYVSARAATSRPRRRCHRRRPRPCQPHRAVRGSRTGKRRHRPAGGPRTPRLLQRHVRHDVAAHRGAHARGRRGRPASLAGSAVVHRHNSCHGRCTAPGARDDAARQAGFVAIMLSFRWFIAASVVLVRCAGDGQPESRVSRPQTREAVSAVEPRRLMGEMGWATVVSWSHSTTSREITVLIPINGVVLARRLSTPHVSACGQAVSRKSAERTCEVPRATPSPLGSVGLRKWFGPWQIPQIERVGPRWIELRRGSRRPSIREGQGFESPQLHQLTRA